ncbi:uncharacterized protein F4822DRAFT_65562 [Hypoxylon trugodes]|uniref:uncharacterized protein n=1 Tax=Hypoxylon trugodes TaxID=326681 RepID=UPI0021A1EDC9|nr:uncharacterized protein F4822DRAFT_65562 [Hypoxylon trugodes]KAI1384295.1 hypothetical protein F4822DRAFT_65562 [Hypoxylon trugodes]
MMFIAILALLLEAAQLVSAHFKINYPIWRTDSLTSDNYSQWTWPCAGVSPDGNYNRTDWPISGGPIQLTLRHPWTYVFVSVGLGDEVADFNMSLTTDLLNTTGNGNFCIPALPAPPMNITDGTKASIQVITMDWTGALYNCADITYRANAKVPDGICHNSSHITATWINQNNEMPMMMTPNATVTVSAPPSATSSPTSAAGTIASGLTFAIMIGLVSIFMIALGI